VDDAAVGESAQRVRAVNAKAEILNLSSFTGVGIDQLVDRILDWKE
jgi:Ni2+-binding GTPase involved in maturation of urease and hydrogenase